MLSNTYSWLQHKLKQKLLAVNWNWISFCIKIMISEYSVNAFIYTSFTYVCNHDLFSIQIFRNHIIPNVINIFFYAKALNTTHPNVFRYHFQTNKLSIHYCFDSNFQKYGLKISTFPEIYCFLLTIQSLIIKIGLENRNIYLINIE